MRSEELERVSCRKSEPIGSSPILEASLTDVIQSVRAQGLEGLVAKRRRTKYEPTGTRVLPKGNAFEGGFRDTLQCYGRSLCPTPLPFRSAAAVAFSAVIRA